MLKKSSFAVLALLLLSAGCQNTVNTLENNEKQSVRKEISDHRVITDRFLKNRLRIESVITSKTPEGLLRVQVSCKNMRVGMFAQFWSHFTGENPYPVQYRFDWFDQNGMKSDTNLSTWHEVKIIPGETVHFQSVAPNASCRDFQLNLKEAENK